MLFSPNNKLASGVINSLTLLHYKPKIKQVDNITSRMWTYLVGSSNDFKSGSAAVNGRHDMWDGEAFF